MSKIIDNLTPGDFGKSFDPVLFAEWKQAANAQNKALGPIFILWLAGLLLMIVLGGLVGLGLFFAAAFTALGISLSKQKKTKEIQRRLGIDNREVRQAIVRSRSQDRPAPPAGTQKN